MPSTSYWIVLDTSVVRETLKGNEALGIDLARLATLRGSAPVSLSQTAYLELTSQIRRGAVPFDQWGRVAPALDAVLDQEHPIVPLGILLRVMLGVANGDGVDLDRGFRGLRAMWHSLKGARSLADLAAGRVVVVEQEAWRLEPAALEGRLQETEQRWADIFEGIAEGLGRATNSEDRLWLADGIRRGVGVDDVARVPELETAVQLAVEWHVLHGRGYKPKLNDAIDSEQLLVLGLPAIICTSDRLFRNRVRQLGTPGSDRVLSPADLLDQLRRPGAVCGGPGECQRVG